MSTGAAIVLVAVIVLMIAGGALLWRWAGQQVAARRAAQAEVVSGAIIAKGKAAIEAERAKSAQEAAETMRRNLARRPR